MTNRTVQIWGMGYGTTPCTIDATFNGTQVFSGNIPTVDSSDVQRLPEDQTTLFTFEIDQSLTGSIPMSMDITGADIFFEQVLVNFATVTNPVFSANELQTLETIGAPVEDKLAIWELHAVPPLSEADIALLSTTDEPGYPARNACLAAHGISLLVNTGETGFVDVNNGYDARSNVVITNAAFSSPQPPDPRPAGTEGTWGWEIEVAAGQTATLACDLVISSLGLTS